MIHGYVADSPPAPPSRPQLLPSRTVTRFAGTVNAPDFPEGLAWINTSRPLTLADLRGKLVVLDFWTFC